MIHAVISLDEQNGREENEIAFKVIPGKPQSGGKSHGGT